MKAPQNVGFIGLGIMGAPMASNLLKAGFPLFIYNRTLSKCERLAAQGAVVCQSIKDLASRCDVVIMIVSDTPDVESVLFGQNGLATALRQGSTVIDMSTISPQSTIEFAARLKRQGIAMLDAPVSGGESGAIAGTLSIMVGGDREAFDQCLPLFQAMGRNMVYTGPSGHGQKTKLVNQVVGSLNLLATVEALRLAVAAGLDPERTLEVVGAGAAGSWMLSNLGPKIANRDFRPGFTIRLHQKDLRLVTEYFRDLGLDAPGTNLAYFLFTTALDKGLGEYGNHGLFQLWD